MSFGGFLQANTQCIVIVGPFVDVTDGFTPETGVTLSGADEAELLKHNTSTVTDIAAATWAAVTNCDGYYALTLTTSHTDTEGFITVVVQDDNVCLPVKMTWQVVAQAAWASLITAKDTGFMDINVKAISEDTTAADNCELMFDGTGYAGGTTKLGVDAVAISGDTTSADNLELQFDGTGLIGDTFPSTQAQVGNIATTGAAAYQSASSFTKTVGGTEVGDYNNVDTSNAVYHQIPDSGGALDVYYEYTLRPDEVAVGVLFKGRMTGTGDNVVCQAYNWTGTAWVTLFTVTGVNTTTDQTNSPSLVSKYTGTASNVGKVRIRFYAASGLTSANLYVDQCILAKASTNISVGYSNGSIWVQTAGLSGTTIGYNGTADRPCPWADALTLNATLGMNRYAITPGSSITLNAALVGAVVSGRSYTLAFGGQNISGSYFEGVEGLSGIGTCATAEAIIMDSHLNAITIGEADFIRCHLMNTVTLSQASVPYRFHDCTGITSAKITFSAANQSAVISRVSGVMTIAGMVSTNTLYIDGDADVTIDNTNNTGTVYIAGNIRLTNSGASMNITDSARWSEEQSVASVTGSIGSLATQAKADVNTEVVDVLRTDTLPDSYSAHEAQPTIAQAILAIHQFLMEREVSGTTVTVQKPDGTTTSLTLTLDDATNPTTIHRSA